MGDLRFIIKHLCIVVAVLLPGAIAESPDQLFFRYKPPKSSEKYRFRIVREFDEDKSLNLTVFFQEERTLMLDSERVLFYGKDLDNDGYADAFFFKDRFVIKQIYTFPPGFTPKDDHYGTHAIVDILNREHKLKNRTALSLAFIGVGKTLTMAISNAEAAGQEFVEMQMYLLELRERALRLPDGDQKAQLIAMVDKGWELNNNKYMDAIDAKTYFSQGAGDMLIAAAAIKVFQWLGKGGKWVLQKTSSTAVGKFVSRQVTVIATKTKSAALPMWFSKSLAQLTFQNLKRTIRLETSKLIVQSRFAHLFVKQFSKTAAEVGKFGGIKVFETYKSGLTGWGYIAQTQLMQVFAEAATRWDEIYDPNPIVLAENLFTDRDFLQNFIYMTNETTLLSGILRGNEGIGRKMKICGTVALINSTAMNLIVKDNVEPKRVALDIGWELTLGIGQTWLDTTVIHSFQKRNPKLKLVGYAIALVDQAAGYWFYSQATEKLEDQAAEKTAQELKPTSNEKLKLIPILAPLP